MARPVGTGVQDLLAFGTEMQNSEFFDEEDLGFWRDAMAAAERMDPAIAVLNRTLPQRQRLMEFWDSRFNLSQQFPDMMQKFARKDAELYQLLQDKIQTQVQNSRN
jgi:hypothetical protein